MEVFLGGTVNGSEWRDSLIPLLDINFFNPVVENWDENAQLLEIEKRNTCDYILYVITPKMSGCYSIAELIQDSCIRPERTLFCIIYNDDFNEFTEHQIKSLDMTKKMVIDSGARVFETLNDVADFLNNIE
jgi:hypothetical protein